MPDVKQKPVFLCVANWDSNVGYAWWLMESFWLQIHEHFQQDYDVIIAYPSISQFPAHIETSTIGKEEFDFRIKSGKDLLTHYRFIQTHKISVLYFSDRPTSHWSYLFFRLCGVRKIIVHDHTPGIRTQPRGLRKLFKIMRARLPGFNANSAIGATEYVKQRLIYFNCFPAARSFSAPNGLPPLPETLEPINLHTQLELSNDTLLIVGTGRATLYKGIDFALDVIAQLVHNEHIVNIHYLYCGDGPDLQILKAKAEALSIERQVTFLGRIDNIDGLLADCDIAFHPSRGEVGYSLSILEYMRAGLPVVISDNPSTCETITHNRNGLIYHEGDITAAVNAFKQLIADKPTRIRFGQQSKEILQKNYTLAGTHRALIQALESSLPPKTEHSGKPAQD